MQGDAGSENFVGNAEQSLIIIVPRAKQELCRSLSHAFGDAANVRVIADRRSRERRAIANGHGLERRRADRRQRADMDAELQAGRWIVVPRALAHIDFLDPKAQAILFLCCGHHVVPCQQCQNTYQLRWIPRADPDVFRCPLCGSDLTPTILAHAQVCRYWPTFGQRPDSAHTAVSRSSALAGSGPLATAAAAVSRCSRLE